MAMGLSHAFETRYR